MDPKRLFTNTFLLSSVLVMSASTIVNVLNYLFNLVMGRLLTPAQFGEVATLIGLSMIVGVPATSLTTLMARRTSTLHAQGRPVEIYKLFSSTSQSVFLLASAFTVLFWLLTPLLSGFLHIPLIPIFIFSLLIPLSLLSALNLGILQGLTRFKIYSFSQFIAAILKLVLGIGAVFLAFEVAGVMAALVFSSIATYYYSYTKVNAFFDGIKLPDAPKMRLHIPKIPATVWTIFFTTLFTTLYSYVDVPLAKHFLNADEAGAYSALSVIGKIVTYGSSSFLGVMLPFVAASIAKKDKNEIRWLKTSFLCVLFISLSVLFCFIFFPTLVVHLLFGQKYTIIIPLLATFGTAMLFNTLSLVFIYFFMASNSRKYIYPLGLTVLAQVGLISYYSQNIGGITQAILISSVLLFTVMCFSFLLSFHVTLPIRQKK